MIELNVVRMIFSEVIIEKELIFEGKYFYLAWIFS